MACDVATVLRKHQFVAQEAAFTLWRQGVSGRDIALAPSLSDPQRLDLIEAVDRLVNRRNLSNRKEKIMTPYEEEAKEIADEGEKDTQGEVEDINLLEKRAADAEVGKRLHASKVNNDEPEGDVGDLKAAFEEGEPSEEDTARLYVALKDSPNAEVMDEAVKMRDGLKEKFVPDFKESPAGGDCGEDVGSDLNLDNLEAFGAVNEKKNPLLPDDPGMYTAPEKSELTGLEDQDRERLTGVDHILDKEVDVGSARYAPGGEFPDPILNEKEKKEDPTAGTTEAFPTYEELTNMYRDLKADYVRLVKELYTRTSTGPCCQRPTAREDVYKLIDGERDYQNYKFGTTAKLTWSPNDWLTLMDRYMIDALDIINDPDAQMIEIRKIAALTVNVMEHILTPARM